MNDNSERIAKRLARAGVASRREAERMIADARVRVNGKLIDSPALNVTPADMIEVDGKPLAAAEPVRMWRYHKPAGLVSTTADEKGRRTIFDALPPEMPRVMSIGRLDLTSEGLLLLTNDGDLKRRLELPSTGWMRRYRVRAKGSIDDAALAPLRAGITVDGERFQPMEVAIDRQQGANVWLTFGLREGRNREIRRAAETVGLEVNRLIRVSYGPFQLGDLARGAVEEIRPKILRDQLGIARTPDSAAQDTPAKPKAPRSRTLRSGAPAKPGPDTRPKAAKPGATATKPGGRPKPDSGRGAGRGPKPGAGRKPGTRQKPGGNR